MTGGFHGPANQIRVLPEAADSHGPGVLRSGRARRAQTRAVSPRRKPSRVHRRNGRHDEYGAPIRTALAWETLQLRTTPFPNFRSAATSGIRQPTLAYSARVRTSRLPRPQPMFASGLSDRFPLPPARRITLPMAVFGLISRVRTLCPVRLGMSSVVSSSASALAPSATVISPRMTHRT
jgi:hypothetical protein